MSPASPTLHLLCGKIAAGKSTLSAKIGDAPNTVVISEDNWLSSLFANEMHSVGDYVRCSGKLRTAMEPHIVSLLNAGVSVVLDFPANTIENRSWMRGIFQAANVAHTLHYLKITDDVCKARLLARNTGGKHAFTVTEEQFDLITKHFVAPTPAESFNVVTYHTEDQATV